MAVEVRAIAARPVRRRGMKPLVEATVFDETGEHARDVLQPAVAGAALHARARGWCCTASRPARGGVQRRPSRASASDIGDARPRDSGRRERRRRVAHYPASEGLSSTQILTLVQGARAALADVPEPLRAARPRCASGCPTARARWRRCTSRAAPREREAGARQARVRGAAAHPAACSCAAAPRRRARRGAPVLTQAPSLSERWLSRSCRSS